MISIMKTPYYFFLILLSLIISTNSFSQKRTITSLQTSLKPISSTITAPVVIRPIYISTTNWQKTNTVGFDLNEIAFINWNAGGANSVSGLLKGNFTRVYSKENIKWVNELIIRYGINKQDGLSITKTDDEFRINSTFGYKKNESSNWYHSAKFNFNTQFTNGYIYPDTSTPISKPFAPAYTFLGTGADYYDKEKQFDIYFSPVTFKNTLVLDETLANKGTYGVTGATYDADGNMISKGKLSKTEFGFLITNYLKKEVWQNITMESRLSLYSDYLNNFGNIDVEWKLQFDMIVNKYVSGNVGLHTIYDDDIKTFEEIDGKIVTKGPKLQLKQSLGIGLVYNF